MRKAFPNAISRRDLVTALGVIGAAGSAGSMVQISGSHEAQAQQPAPRGTIPNRSIKIGHMTYLTGPAAVLGEPSLKGHLLAAEEINEMGGILGRRKIETIPVDEAGGTDANVNQFRRMKVSDNVALFTGVVSSGNVLALGPVAEELGLLTIFVGGNSDLLFDRFVPVPKRVFRITNIGSADSVTCAVGAAMTWPDATKIAHIHSDYSYGRSSFDHFNMAYRKLVPGVEVVSEVWPKLGTTDFSADIASAISANPDLIVSSLWGGDYTALYKQALRFGMFDKAKFASTLAFGVVPGAIKEDHPQHIIAGVGANYFFTYPPPDVRPANTRFVRNFYARWKEYPNYMAEGAYTALYLYKTAVEKINQLTGGWPDDEAIISQLEGLSWDSPASTVYVRADNHQCYKDAVTGFSRNLPQYQFAAWDPNEVITIPIRNITAPPNWPKPGAAGTYPTSTYHFIDKTWPNATAAGYPEFPWPPPPASATVVIPRARLRGSGRQLSRLSDVDSVIVGALVSAGYVEKSYYSVPGGFALVVRLEQINDDGTPKPLPDRWAIEVPPMRQWNLAEYLRRLFLAESGYYRVVAIIISSRPFSQTGAIVPRDQAAAWLTRGLNRLPGSIGDLSLSDAYTCTALVYEFEQPTAGKPTTLLRVPGRLGAMTHLEKSGIWAGLER